jgi:hypothetical protein
MFSVFCLRSVRSCQACYLLGIVLLIGCGSNSQTGNSEAEQKLRVLGVLYGKYLGMHNGEPPKDEQEFRKFLNDNLATTIKQMGLNKIDEILLSPRDNSPLIVTYGSDDRESLDRVIAYEEKGVDGTRAIVTARGSVEFLQENEFQIRIDEVK